MSGVSNGQSANQTTFNNAFMARNGDTDTSGKVDLNNVDTVSGSAITNVQRELNAIGSFTGKTINVAKGAVPSWTSTAVGASGDNLTQRAEALTAKIGTILTGTQEFSGSKTFDNLVGILGPLIIAASSDTASGDGATLSTPSTIMVKLTNGSLNSVSYITPNDAAKAQIAIIINISGGTIQINDRAGDSGIYTGTGVAFPLADNAACMVAYDPGTLTWYMIGGAGGGGSAAGTLANLVARGVDGMAPIESYTYGFKEFEFDKGAEQAIFFSVLIPSTFITGTALNIQGKYRSSSSSGNIVMKAEVSLFRDGDAPGSPTVNGFGFNSTLAAATTVNTFTLVMPNSGGFVNPDSQIEAGDLLYIKLTRKVADVSDTLTTTAIIAAESLELQPA